MPTTITADPQLYIAIEGAVSIVQSPHHAHGMVFIPAEPAGKGLIGSLSVTQHWFAQFTASFGHPLI